MILLDYLFAMWQMHKDSVQGLGMKLLWGQFSLGTASIFVWKDFRCPEKKYVCLVDAGVMHSLCCFCLLKLICLATPKPEPGRAGQNSYQRSNRYTLTLSFPTFVHVPKENFVSYFIVEWGPCSRIKLGTLGGDTRRRYHLAWSHNVTCYNSLHVIQAQIDLRFCVAGQQNGAREAVWSLCFVTWKNVKWEEKYAEWRFIHGNETPNFAFCNRDTIRETCSQDFFRISMLVPVYLLRLYREWDDELEPKRGPGKCSDLVSDCHSSAPLVYGKEWRHIPPCESNIIIIFFNPYGWGLCINYVALYFVTKQHLKHQANKKSNRTCWKRIFASLVQDC